MRSSCSKLTSIGWVFTAAFLFSGCVTPNRPGEPHPSPLPVAAPEWHDELRRRTQTEFATGALYKPNPDAMPSGALRLTPLIVLNTEHADCAVENPLYAVSGVQDPPAQPMVRVDYGWQVRCQTSRSSPASVERYGLSIVLGRDGFPLWAQAARWSNDRFEPETVFVSRTLEDAAIAGFSSPLPGRAYVIERGLDEAPDQVVAGILEDGPIPMGPYVYMDPLRAGVVTILCRCSPSQVDNIIATATYDPLDETSKVRRQDDSWFINGAYPKLRWPSDDGTLGRKGNDRPR